MTGHAGEDRAQQAPDRDVVGQDVADDRDDAGRTAPGEDRSHETGTDSASLPSVDDLDGELGPARLLADEAGDADRLGTVERPDG